MEHSPRLCPITKAERLNPATASIELFAPGLAKEAAAGQFLHIACGKERILRRPISVCDAGEDILRIVFEIKGEGTRWLASQKEGTLLDILGPLGRGFTLPEKGKILLIGGGAGTYPLLFAARQAKGEAYGVFGFQNKEKIVLKSEFFHLSKNITYATEDGSFGERGFVTTPAEKLLQTEKFHQILACGPVPMLKAVAALAQKYGVPCEVSLEERMGCGVGACLVCACKTRGEDGAPHYRRACKDGPVFDSREVVFDA